VLTEFTQKEDDYYNKNRNSWNEIDDLKRQLAKISNENEILTQQVSEAKSKLDVCNSKCMSMEKEHDSLQSQIENLTSSKQVIQKTMSEEIVSIKNTLNGLR